MSVARARKKAGNLSLECPKTEWISTGHPKMRKSLPPGQKTAEISLVHHQKEEFPFFGSLPGTLKSNKSLSLALLNQGESLGGTEKEEIFPLRPPKKE